MSSDIKPTSCDMPCNINVNLEHVSIKKIGKQIWKEGECLWSFNYLLSHEKADSENDCWKKC